MQVNGEQTDHFPKKDVGLGLLIGLGGPHAYIQSHTIPSLLPDRAGKLPTSYHTL
jgi:hypothetical protein